MEFHIIIIINIIIIISLRFLIPWASLQIYLAPAIPAHSHVTSYIIHLWTALAFKRLLLPASLSLDRRDSSIILKLSGSEALRPSVEFMHPRE